VARRGRGSPDSGPPTDARSASSTRCAALPAQFSLCSPSVACASWAAMGQSTAQGNYIQAILIEFFFAFFAYM